MPKFCIRVYVEASNRQHAYQSVAELVNQRRNDRYKPPLVMSVEHDLTYTYALDSLQARARRHGCFVEVTNGAYTVVLNNKAPRRHRGRTVLETTDLMDVHIFLDGHTWGSIVTKQTTLSKRAANTRALNKQKAKAKP